jgi:acetylornithine/succinyldiaminopimelate/putrescine aminotransferase
LSVAEQADRHLTPNYARFPVEFVRGEGARLWDSDGVEYLDFLCGISVSSVGHCHPAVVAAIREQAGRLIHVGNLYYTEPMARLAERLAECSLGGKVFFTNSGTEAVEAALKCARKARQGGTIVSLHGPSTGGPTARCRRRPRSQSRRRSRRSSAAFTASRRRLARSLRRR